MLGPSRRAVLAVVMHKLLAGRLPAANVPQEVAVSQIGAQQLHLRVGSTLRMTAMDQSTPPHTRGLTERVVGVFVTEGSVVPVNDQDQQPESARTCCAWSTPRGYTGSPGTSPSTASSARSPRRTSTR